MINGFDGNVKTSVAVLTQNIFSSSMYTTAKNIANVITPFALTIISICFFIEFIRLTMRMDILKWEYVIMLFFKVVVAKCLISCSYKLLVAIYATAAEWITKAGSSTSTLGSQVGTALAVIIKKMGFFEVLALVCSMGISFLAIWIAGMIIVVIAYARMFELLVYVSVSPLPFSFLMLSDGGGSRITKKFIFSFASVCLQGLFIIISIKLYSAICVAAIIPAVHSASSLSDISFNMLLGALVLVMAVVKSSSWAKNVLDAV